MKWLWNLFRRKPSRRKCPRFSSVFIEDCAAIYGGTVDSGVTVCRRCFAEFDHDQPLVFDQEK